MELLYRLFEILVKVRWQVEHVVTVNVCDYACQLNIACLAALSEFNDVCERTDCKGFAVGGILDNERWLNLFVL